MTKLEEALEDLLSCPRCGGPLTARGSERLLTTTARCEKCATEYPIRDGILDFLSPLDNKANP